MLYEQQMTKQMQLFGAEILCAVDLAILFSYSQTVRSLDFHQEDDWMGIQWDSEKEMEVQRIEDQCTAYSSMTLGTRAAP